MIIKLMIKIEIRIRKIRIVTKILRIRNKWRTNSIAMIILISMVKRNLKLKTDKKQEMLIQEGLINGKVAEIQDREKNNLTAELQVEITNKALKVGG